MADPALLSFSYQQFQISYYFISFLPDKVIFSGLTMIIHGYFEEYTFQYCSGRRGLYVCVLRAGPDLGPGLKTSGRARAENSGPLRLLLHIIYLLVFSYNHISFIFVPFYTFVLNRYLSK